MITLTRTKTRVPPAAVAAAQLWNAMPGWGIVADLTPPELTNSRHLTVLRKLIGAGLVALLLVGVGGYVLAVRLHSSAARARDDVQARTSTLQSEARKYAGVTTIQSTVAQTQLNIAKLMSGDVDLDALMDGFRARLPATMTIAQESIMLTAAGPAGTAASAGVATAGVTLIGTVTLSGGGHTLDDLAVYVDELKVMPGVVNVVPTSNTAAGKTVKYSLTLALTDRLLSHRFDVSKGVK